MLITANIEEIRVATENTGYDESVGVYRDNFQQITANTATPV